MKKRSIVLLLISLIITKIVLAQEHPIEDHPFPHDERAQSFTSEENRYRAVHANRNMRRKKFKGHDKKRRLMDYLDKEMPDLSARLKTLKEEHPFIVKLFFKELKNRQSKLLFMSLKKEKNEENKMKIKKYFSNELEILILSAEYKSKQDESQKKKITNLIKESFDLKLYLQQEHCKFMEKRIADLKNKLEKRKSFKEKIISQRLEELTQDPEIISW